jgi:uncharacterized protein YjbI with pentapeptide repeats
MKTINTTELKSILDQHRLWVETNRVQGARADLTYADLTYANLKGADLTYANLKGAYLTYANLKGANLNGANLTGTILDKKTEKKAEIASVNAESTIRSEIEAIAKKHGMKIASLTLELL